MQLDIYANVFHPLQAGEPFLVVASAFPSINRSADAILRGRSQSAMAASLEDAMRRCRELAAELSAMLRQAGEDVRDVHIRDLR